MIFLLIFIASREAHHFIGINTSNTTEFPVVVNGGQLVGNAELWEFHLMTFNVNRCLSVKYDSLDTLKVW